MVVESLTRLGVVRLENLRRRLEVVCASFMLAAWVNFSRRSAGSERSVGVSSCEKVGAIRSLNLSRIRQLPALA